MPFRFFSRALFVDVAVAVAVTVTVGGAARAERADSSKQTIVDAASITINDVTQTRTLVGNVELQRGTLLMKAGRAIIKSDPEGYVYATFYADPGSLATFRQKRDGGDIWDEGEAERIEYDNKLEIVKLFSKAKITTVENKRKTQEVQGPYLSYDSRKEVYAVENDVSGTTKADGGRVRMVIEPKLPPAPGAAPAPAPASAPAPGVPAAAKKP
ncbi:lipopolysaccharide transport periplasmic protein LptA [Massilia sp. PWRC2]|uniref:lipopolysaccharide transport periplasmic protein LptA n=1 Tax=Massilia sp. PWRC2 TaxID=2804626 RepID=UPI003CEB0684